MKVVIIGSNSFLAKYITREFVKCNIRPSLFGRSASAEFPDLELYSFEIPGEPIALLALLDFDIVIYTAGAGIQSGLKESSDLIYELNSFSPIKIFNFLSDNSFKGKVISFGSYFEIGDEREERYYTELDVALSNKPVPNHYCSSKRVLTRFLISAPVLPDYFHFILPNIYGKGESSNRLVPYLINSIIQGTEIKLTSGSQVRQYIHAEDIATIVLRVVNNEFPKGLYNLCNVEPVQIKELVKNVFKVMGKEDDFYKLNFGNNERGDTAMPFLLLDNYKSKEVLKFQSKITLEEGIGGYL